MDRDLWRSLNGLPVLSVNEARERLDMDYNNIWFTGNAATTSTSTVTIGTTTNSNPLYQPARYWVSYGDASWAAEPAKPAKVKKDRPETDMQWLKRRISEVSWVPV